MSEVAKDWLDEELPEEVIWDGFMKRKNNRRAFQGCVVHVTPRGGINVQITDAEPWCGPGQYFRKHGMVVRWVRYSDVAQYVSHKARESYREVFVTSG